MQKYFCSPYLKSPEVHWWFIIPCKSCTKEDWTTYFKITLPNTVLQWNNLLSWWSIKIFRDSGTFYKVTSKTFPGLISEILWFLSLLVLQFLYHFWLLHPTTFLRYRHHSFQLCSFPTAAPRLPFLLLYTLILYSKSYCCCSYPYFCFQIISSHFRGYTGQNMHGIWAILYLTSKEFGVGRQPFFNYSRVA